jgi:hypothetical protein
LGIVDRYPGSGRRSRAGVEFLASYTLDGSNSSVVSDHNHPATGNVNAACDGACSAIGKARQQWRVFHSRDHGHALRERFAPYISESCGHFDAGRVPHACSMRYADIKVNLKLK